MYIIYVEKQEINDATSFYIDIIKDSIKLLGEDFKEVQSANDINRNDIVIVITIKTFFLTWMRNPRQKILIWFQGILPEENLMMFTGMKKYVKYAYNRLLERLALSYCAKAFFVSEAMNKHYKKVYSYNGDKHFIMPCFNQELEEQYFNDQKYLQPTFVYAGNLAQWQCVDKTLELFSKIKKEIPNARITLLTKEKEKANNLAKQYGITDIEVKYIPYTELNKEMSRHKYGFLIREDTAVNNVATPTKMNSYMACGVIPIFSDVIGDFKERLKDVKHKITVSTLDNCIEDIKTIENETLRASEILNEYRNVFNAYYSRTNYIEGIVKFIEL